MKVPRFYKFLFLLTVKKLSIARLYLRDLYLTYLKNYLSKFFAFCGLASIITLTLELGFYYPADWVKNIKFINNFIINYFILYEIITFLFYYEKIYEYWYERKPEGLITSIVVLQKIFSKDIIFFLETMELGELDTDTASLAFLAINQTFFIFSNLISFIRSTKIYSLKKLNPSFMFFASFAAIIFLGVIFLFLPKMHSTSLSFVDILFTVISATCVTGLSTIDISQALSFRGQFVLMILIQVGGLGLITLTSFFSIFLAGQVSVTETLMMKDLLSEDALGKVKKLILGIAFQTFIIEFLGAIYLFFTFPDNLELGFLEKIFFCIFHSISAFCNAGFSLVSDGFGNKHIWNEKSFLSGIMFLIVLGGLGFGTIQDIYKKIINYGINYYRVSVSTRLILIVSILLLILGFWNYFLLEQNYTLKNLSLEDQIFHSLFYSITTRTAGFNTLDLSQMGTPIVFFSLFLMWVGASPNSTGGGIKTTTVAVSFLQIFAFIRGKDKLEIFNRTIALGSIRRASITIVLSLFVIFAAIFVLVIVEPFPFLDICFEVVSAYGTVGLTRGITPQLSSISKLCICFVMFAGRVGILTILIAMIPKKVTHRYDFPSEYVLVG